MRGHVSWIGWKGQTGNSCLTSKPSKTLRVLGSRVNWGAVGTVDSLRERKDLAAAELSGFQVPSLNPRGFLPSQHHGREWMWESSPHAPSCLPKTVNTTYHCWDQAFPPMESWQEWYPQCAALGSPLRVACHMPLLAWRHLPDHHAFQVIMCR